MIIKCPKCQTEFDVDDSLLSHKKTKFQCAECAFVWSLDLEDKKDNSFDIDTNEKKKLLYGLGVEEKSIDKNVRWYHKLFYPKNVFVFFLGLILFFIIFMLFNFIYNYSFSSSNQSQSIFDKKEQQIDTSKLYIELVTPLTLVREGGNDYIIIRGFIYNPTQNILPIPKLIISIENKYGRLLQEQEREIEVKELAPLEKTDFMFKVFMFSDQVFSVKVDLADSDKI